MGAVNDWSGAISNDWNVAGNWSAGVPAATHTVVFSGVPTNSPEVNLAAHAIKLDDLLVTQSYSGHIGAVGAGNGLEIGSLVVRIDSRIGDSAGINVEGEAAGNKLDSVLVRGGIAELRGNIESLEIVGGTVALYGNLTGGGLSIDQTVESPTNVFIDTSALMPTNTNMNGGVVICEEDLNNLYMSGGEWTQRDNLNDLYQNGGTFFYDNGDIAEALITNGTFDGSQSTNARLIGVVLGTTTLTMHPPAYVNLDDGVGRITLAHPIICYGGTIKLLPGTLITI